MGFFDKFKKKEERALTWDDFGGQSLFSNSVTTDKTLTVSAVYASISILSSSIAGLPIQIYQKTNDGKQRISNIPLTNLLKIQVNSNLTSFSMKELMMIDLLLYGNSFWQISRNKQGQVIALFPMDPRSVKITLTNDGVIYQYTDIKNRIYTFDKSEVFHIKAFSLDGVVGYPPLKIYESQIKGALALQDFANAFFENGANVGGILEHPAQLSKQALENLQASFKNKYTGVKNSSKPLVLEEGMKFNRLAIPNDQAQFLESRKFSVNDVARIFRIPPHMLAEMDKATFSNIEHQSIEFVRDTLRSWIVRIEQEINIQLLSPRDRANGYFVEFLIDSILRGDTKSRFEAYKIAIQNGWMSINEVRQLENMNKIDGGDVHAFPLNMTTLDNLGGQNV